MKYFPNKLKIKFNRVKYVFVLAFMIFLAMEITIYADDGRIEHDKADCSIAITPHSIEEGNPVIKNTMFALYRVASVLEENGKLVYSLTDDFAASSVNLDDVFGGFVAHDLEAYVRAEDKQGRLAKSDENGTVRFQHLQLGLYLLVQDFSESQTPNLVAEPFLISIPMPKEESDSWVYDVAASPKIELYEKIDITVRIRWSDGDDEGRPDNITVGLYDGDELIEVVIIGEHNDWTYVWEDLDPRGDYSVKEMGADGYTVSYDRENNVFIITNTLKLVQTGQMNFPIPILACGGILLFVIGCQLTFTKRNENA